MLLSAGKHDVTATIANGTSLSAVAVIGDGVLTGILMPAAWTAAVLTFQGSFDGTTFGNLFDDAGTEYVVAADVSRYIAIQPGDFAGVKFLKVRSGTSGVAVNQAAARSLTLVVRQA